MLEADRQRRQGWLTEAITKEFSLEERALLQQAVRCCAGSRSSSPPAHG